MLKTHRMKLLILCIFVACGFLVPVICTALVVTGPKILADSKSVMLINYAILVYEHLGCISPKKGKRKEKAHYLYLWYITWQFS